MTKILLFLFSNSIVQENNKLFNNTNTEIKYQLFTYKLSSTYIYILLKAFITAINGIFKIKEKIIISYSIIICLIIFLQI